MEKQVNAKLHGHVKVVRDVVLKPRPPFSSGSCSHSYFQIFVPFTIFDLATFDEHPPRLFTFRAPCPDNTALIDALVRALFHYPHLAGSLTTDAAGWPGILLNDHGVRLVETQVDSSLDDHFPFDPSSDLVVSLIPDVLAPRHLCQVQLNRFSCGGLAIGFTANHKVGDGPAISTFLAAWALAVRGATGSGNLSVVVPLWSKPALQSQEAAIRSRDPPRCLFPHAEIEFASRKNKEKNHKGLGDVAASVASMTNVSIHYSKEFVSRLKNDMLDGGNGGGQPMPPNTVRYCSTFECVLAHFWKNITAARCVHPQMRTCARIAVNGRRGRLRDPPIPVSYFGNLVLWAFPAMTAGDLLAASYSEVVAVIRDAVEKIDEWYFRSFIDFGELVRRGETAATATELVPSLPEAGDALCPDLEVNSWLGLEFEMLDFGCGRTCGVMPPNLPMEGVTLIVPSSREDGAVDVYVALKNEHVSLFRKLFSSWS